MDPIARATRDTVGDALRRAARRFRDRTALRFGRLSSTLVAWGAFWFERSGRDDPWRIVDDDRLPEVAAGRRGCIGASAEPYGDTVVEALDATGGVVARAHTAERAWAWLDGLSPDTAYRYRIVVDGSEWAAGERWDWVPSDRGGYDLVRLEQNEAQGTPVPATRAAPAVASSGSATGGTTNAIVSSGVAATASTNAISAAARDTTPAVAPEPEPDPLAGASDDAVWWGLLGGGVLVVALLLRPVLARRRT